MEIEFLAFVLSIFLLAGFVKGVIGLGLPTVSLALLTAFIELPVAVMLMVIPSAVTNIWQAVDGPHTMALLRRFWTLLLASVVGVINKDWGEKVQQLAPRPADPSNRS